MGAIPSVVENLVPAIKKCFYGLTNKIAEVTSEATFSQMAKHIVKNPVQFTFQAIGGVAMLASAATVPVLGAIGFSAGGPVAGSIAAGVQASIGHVQAGSLFAWCQSAAMGGVALGGVFTGMLGGAGVAGAATAGPVLWGKLEELVEARRKRALRSS